MIKQVDVLDLEINIVILLTDFMNIPRFQRLTKKKTKPMLLFNLSCL